MSDQDRLIAGRYRLGETAGVGAMGIVWRARDERLRRTVAVKQLLPRPGFDKPLTEYARLRAMREARIAARLQHPNVVTVFDVVEEDAQPWLIMEYVPSRSLALVLREHGPMKPYQVAEIGAQAAAGLAAAHAVGVVHRDVKPGNVLLGDDGTVKITDFGISRSLDDVVATSTGLVTGTPAYLAPEVAKGMVPQPSSDVFALGSTLYAAVQGQPPFGLGDNPLALLNAVAAGKVTPPSNGGPLTPLLMRMLQADPAKRPTMRAIQADLAELAAQRTITTRAAGADPGAVWEPIAHPEPDYGDYREEWPWPGVTPAFDPDMEWPDDDMPRHGMAALRPPPPKPMDQDVAFAPSSMLVDPPGDLADDLLSARMSAAMPGTQAIPVRRRRPVRLAALVVIALLAVGTAVFVVDRAGHVGNQQAGGTSNAAPPSDPAPTTLPAGPPSFLAMTNLVTRYYGLLPGDTNDAWMLLSARYQRKVTFDQFRNFYATIVQVVPNDFHQVGPNTVTAVVNFVTRRGAVTHEPYRFTIVNRDGLLIIDNAVAIDRASANTVMSGMSG